MDVPTFLLLMYAAEGVKMTHTIAQAIITSASYIINLQTLHQWSGWTSDADYEMDFLTPSVENIHVEAHQYTTTKSRIAKRGLHQFNAGDPVLARNYGRCGKG